MGAKFAETLWCGEDFETGISNSRKSRQQMMSGISHFELWLKNFEWHFFRFSAELLSKKCPPLFLDSHGDTTDTHIKSTRWLLLSLSYSDHLNRHLSSLPRVVISSSLQQSFSFSSNFVRLLSVRAVLLKEAVSWLFCVCSCIKNTLLSVCPRRHKPRVRRTSPRGSPQESSSSPSSSNHTTRVLLIEKTLSFSLFHRRRHKLTLV